MIRFSLLWLAIFIIFPFVWQRCNLFNLDQLISTLSPNGIILNTCQLNPPLSITETTYIGVCDAFPDSSLPIGLFGWLLWGLFLFQLAYRSSLVDCFGAFADFSLLFGFFGWLLWGLFLFRLAYRASLGDCFGASADSSLLFGFFEWLLWRFCWFQLAYWLLSGDCFGAFADSSLPISFFWVTALRFSLIPACLCCGQAFL